MKKITLFQAFGELKKVGAVKTYTHKKSGETRNLQNYSVNGHLFSLFGDSQIKFHDELVGRPVILFGRIETKQTDSGFRTSFLCDSLRLNYQEEHDFGEEDVL